MWKPKNSFVIIFILKFFWIYFMFYKKLKLLSNLHMYHWFILLLCKLLVVIVKEVEFKLSINSKTSNYVYNCVE